MNTATVALIPALGKLLEGVDWEVTEKQQDKVSSDVSVEPIEDPNRAYLIDFNQDKPAELSLTLIVSANPCGIGGFIGGGLNFENLKRPQTFYKSLLDLKRKQTTTPDALLDVFTGTYFYRNMGITEISTSRASDRPNTLVIDLNLIEFRFAKPPEIPQGKTPLKASKGPFDNQNKKIVLKKHRPILEATKQENQAKKPTYVGLAKKALEKGIK